MDLYIFNWLCPSDGMLVSGNRSRNLYVDVLLICPYVQHRINVDNLLTSLHNPDSCCFKCANFRNKNSYNHSTLEINGFISSKS